MFVHQPAHVRSEHAKHARALDRFNRRRAPLILEQRQLPENVARAEGRERDRAPVAVAADCARAAAADDIAGVAGVPLPEDDLAGLEITGDGELRDPLQVAPLER